MKTTMNLLNFVRSFAGEHLQMVFNYVQISKLITTSCKRKKLYMGRGGEETKLHLQTDGQGELNKPPKLRLREGA